MPHMKQPQYDRYFVCQYEEAGNYHINIIHDCPNTGHSQRAFGDDAKGMTLRAQALSAAHTSYKSHCLSKLPPCITTYSSLQTERRKKLSGSDNLDANNELGEGAEVDQAPVEGDEQAEDMDVIQAKPPHAENIDIATNDGHDLTPLLLHVDPANTEVQDTNRTIVTCHNEPMDHHATELVQVLTNRNDSHGNSAHVEPDTLSADDCASATVTVAALPSSEHTPHIKISDNEIDDPLKSSIIKVTLSNEKPVQKHRKCISVVPSPFAHKIIEISNSEDDIEPVHSPKQLFVIEPSSSQKCAHLS
ncbi:hypothetical protein EDD85DRAFT_961852 [Armillaria nabsnona]|nr:hypothetical protein EDD85DRAFT_961852 [Armillaria nabsnona]